MPGFAVGQSDPHLFPDAPSPQVFDPPPEDFTGQIQSAFRAGWDVDRVGAREEAWRSAMWERHAAVEQSTGKALSPSLRMLGVLGDPDAARAMSLAGAGQPDGFYEQAVDKLRREHPQAMAGVESRDQVQGRVDANLNTVADRASRAGLAPRIIGGLGAGLVDPLNLAVGLGTGGLGEAGLATRMLHQAGVWGTLAAAEAPLKGLEASQVGGPAYGLGDAGSDILTSAAGGPIFEALGSGAKGVFRAALARVRPAAEAAGPAARGALNQLDQADILQRALGDLDGPTHEEGLDSLLNAKPLPEQPAAKDLPDLFGDPQPDAPSSTPGITGQSDYYGRPIYQATFDPGELGTDPARFQYKADADAAGVTARLKGVEAWDPTASGKVIVFQDADGRKLIADGHQRLGLAQRLDKAGFEPKLDGYQFNASDGWNARQVRTIAALKNIREGSGTILDAAKVFRDAPEALADRSLPVTGDFITQARGLAKLSPEAFGAVVNKVIPERYGAELGAMAGDRPDLHAGLVKLLHAGEPSNFDDARALIGEGLQDDWIKSEGEQGALFGGEAPESTVIARAKVKSAVLQALRKDARLFGQLVRHADAIEAGGNALVRDANETAAIVSRTALEVISRLSLRAGDVGEALAAAAREVHAGKRPADAARGLLQMVRSRLAAGEQLDGVRLAGLDPKPPTAQAEDLAAKLDDVRSPEAQALAKDAPEDKALAEAAPFEDLAEPEGVERAHARLKACAPGE